ncbi:hypothetical protein TWF102_004805 [Orbilia oligospora]|uniref:F-box domain-containing protein n=1 Tax=Orbilia oligospora TaxID=2813651 RepID=A0A7C8JMA2_ORBOL|nr:hypothetical protein TWF706_006566 [Orbilia oligospora]KAF3101555.1 hypothetical protein TWF102_004805 [Orbilia oligospora]KAF3105572.1 hypothetical protein TWF103_006630 [Orbilia oligospora]KAF3125548.1 hypothetical protein TWF594_001540 [Orbilia oligospora]KAF3127641.1 hypothetical protein TWF703_009895 [Orbilia oligospora]
MSEKPTELKHSSGELADELESFRRQWKEDLQSQRQPLTTTTPQPNSDVVPTSSSSSSNPIDHTTLKAPHKRRHSQNARDTIPQDLLAQRQHDIDGFRSLDLDVKLTPSLGSGERILDSAPLTTGLEHYEAAVEKEKDGRINESVRLYRRAFKLDPSVHERFKEKHYPKQPASGKPKNAESAETSEQRLLPTEELVNTFAGVTITAGESINLASLKGKDSYKKAPTCPISTIPREILIHIFSMLAATDLPSFVRSATVCKSICYLIYTERQFWRELCKNAYENMIWGPSWACDIKGGPLLDHDLDKIETGLNSLGIIEEDDSEGSGEEEVSKLDVLPTRPIDEIEVIKYNSSYRLMFIERPRIRYNGIYISTCTYLRQGHQAASSMALSTIPVHMVTYYRYLRFFPSGFAIHLLTPAEPSDVVHSITIDNYNYLSSIKATTSTNLPSHFNNIKHILPARWRVHFNPHTYPSPNSTDEPGHRIQIESKGSDTAGRYINTLDLTLKMRPRGIGGRRGYGDRLSWNSYTSFNVLTEDKGAYSLKNDKPFYFSRVKSYEREVLREAEE